MSRPTSQEVDAALHAPSKHALVLAREVLALRNELAYELQLKACAVRSIAELARHLSSNAEVLP